MADVFVSYTRTDAVAAKVIADALSAHGLIVFYDANIPTGDVWDERIEHEAKSAKAIAVLWSKTSRTREWVRNEARVGKDKGILFPARLDDCEVPIEFTHIQTANLIGMPTVAVTAFCDGIRKKLNDAQAGTAPSQNLRNEQLSPPWSNQLEEELARTRGAHCKFNTSKLHPELVAASEAARRAELSAIGARYHALHCYDRAETSAKKARAGDTKDGIIQLHDGDLFEGDNPGGRGLFLKMTGFGIRTTSADGPHRGDRYVGQFLNGRASGAGVYAYGRNANNRNTLRYEGEFALDKKSGVGFYFWRNGDRYAGTFADDVVSGPGVHLFADGRRQEGYALDWFADGHGIEWAADGTVLRAGIWSRNRMIKPLTTT